MAVKDFPADLCPSAESWSVEYNTQEFVSDLNGATQTAELPGARWTASMTFANKRGRNARRLIAFLASLKGMAGRFYVTPTDWQPNGTPEGTGEVETPAIQGSSEIESTGWDPSIPLLFASGDYFEINEELKIVEEDVSSDSSGSAVIKFAPPLRAPVTAGMQFRVVEPRCVMLLSSDDEAQWSIDSPMIYAVNVRAKEALDI